MTLGSKGIFMNNWLKENWFKVGILISLFVLSISFFYQHSPSLPEKSTVTKSQLVFERKSAKEDLALQKGCSEAAENLFNKTDFKDNKMAGFTNHYNKKLNKCFIEVTSTTVQGKSSFTYRALFDVYENKMYGEYDWKTEEGKKYWEVKPFLCSMLDQSCSTTEEFDSFVENYLEG